MDSWQGEYSGPVVLPYYQLERKAQRSPSLRLRFGRRSDPDLALHWPDKRWFDGDVHQKPIRSPSLRLRFGRRSDPSMISTYSSSIMYPTPPTIYNRNINPSSPLTMDLIPIDRNSIDEYQIPSPNGWKGWRAWRYLYPEMAAIHLDDEKFRNLLMLFNEIKNSNYKYNEEQSNGGWYADDVHQSNSKDDKQQLINNYVHKTNPLLITDNDN